MVKDILKLLKNNIFVIVLVFIAIVTVTIVIGTFANDNNSTSNADLSYTFTLGGSDLQSFTVNAGETKLVEFKVKNTNNYTIKYGIIYNVTDNTNVTVKETNYSIGHAIDTLGKDEIKIVSVEVNNSSDINQTFNFNTILGYENAGELSIPADYQLVTGINILDVTGTTDMLINTEKSSLVNYRIYGDLELQELPSDYKQVEYLSTGSGNTQYIDTEYVPKFTTKIELDAQLTWVPTGTYRFLFGARDNSNDNKSWFELIKTNTDDTWRFHDGTSTYLVDQVADTERHMFILDGYNKEAYIDDTLVSTFEEPDEWPNTETTLLLLRTDYGKDGVWEASIPAKIFGCKIYENNVLIRNYVPCYRISDGTIGLYDTINGVFYTNSGTGTFGKGADVSDLTVNEYRGVNDIKINKAGTNLFDGLWTNGFIYTVTGEGWSSEDRIRTKNYIPVEANTEYTFTFADISRGMMYYYDQDKNYLSYEQLNSRNFTTPKNCYYIRFNTLIEDKAYIDDLINGTYVSRIEKYPGSSSYEIALSEPLRRIGNYADYIDYKSGKLVRYIGVIKSYNGEKVKWDYISSTGELSIGSLVYYVMDTPSIMNIDLPEIEVGKDTTTFDIASNVSPSKFIIRYYGM